MRRSPSSSTRWLGLPLLAAAITLLTGASAARALSIEFDRPYDSNRTHRGGAVLPTPDGGYFMVGSALDTLRGVFFKTDAAGNVLRSGTFASNVFVNSLIAMDDGGYCVGTGAGNSSLMQVFRLDSLGAVVWSRSYGSGNLRSLIRTSDGGMAAIGRVGMLTTEDLFLLRLDAAGNVVWQKTYDLTMTNFLGQDLAETSDGGFLAATNQVDGGDTQILYMRTDSSGDSLWTRTYGVAGLDYVTGIVAGPGDSYVACGHRNGDSYVVKLDGSGNVLWEHSYDSGGDDQAVAIHRLGAGGYRVAEWDAVGGSTHDVRVMEITEVGDSTWTRVYGGGGDDLPRDIAPTPDGGYIVTGTTQSFPVGENHLYLVKGAAKASFAATPRSGTTPLLVQFTDRSAGSPSGWAWDFDGDGTTDATTRNPSFTYTTGGSFSVRLVAAYGAMADSVVAPNLVQVACGTATSFPGFVDVTPPPMQAVRLHHGAAWGDYDGDGYPDLLVSGHSGAYLYHNNAGTSFTETSLGGPLLRGAAWADYDRDGDLDLFIGATGSASEFYRNDGGSPTPVSLPPITNPGGASRAGAAWADYDRDGDADLLVISDNGASTFFRNDSTLGFVDASAIGLGDPLPAVGVAWADYDGDGDPDVAVGRMGPAERLLRNNGASFTDVTPGALAGPTSVRGLAWGDYDNDGDMDLFVCDIDHDRLYRNDGGTLSLVAGLPAVPSDGCTWGDFDNDGDLDLFLTSNPGNAFLRNDAGTFVNVTVPACSSSDFGPGIASADYDRDGDLDVFIAQWGAPSRLLRNQLGPGNHWLEVRLRGEQSDRNGIGARIRVRTGSVSRMREVVAGSGYMSQDDLTAHFGLGSATVADSVIVSWPSGVRQVLTSVLTNQLIQVHEPTPSYDDSIIVVPVVVTTISNPVAQVPVVHRGTHSLGVVALVFNYDSSKLGFTGVQSRVSGETFSAGIVNGRISIQWFDETAGADPITPGEDTLFVMQFTCIGANTDSSRITIERTQSGIGDAVGNPVTSLKWLDASPYGWVRVNLGASLAGRVGYFWQDRNVPRAVLSLGGAIPNQLSSSTGTYSFGGLSTGNYTLAISKDTDLDGINALDAIKVVRHASGTEPLGNPNKEIAANVNGDGLVNAFDAIKIVRAAVGLEPLASGDWRFVPPSRSYSPLNANLASENFVAIRMGDANGDWLPSGAAPQEMAARQDAAGPALSIASVSASPSDASVDIPVEVTGFTGIGAVSLRITFAPSVLAFMAVVSQVSGVTFTANAVADEIRIEWFDSSGGSAPINLGSGTLLRLRLDPVGSAGQVSPLQFRAAIVGDAAGNPISGVQTTDGQCTLSDPTAVPWGGHVAEFSLTALPNPMRTACSIEFGTPRTTGVALQVYNLAGQVVRTLVDGELDAGLHRVTWDGHTNRGDLAPAGLYFLRLRAGAQAITRKALLIR